MNGLIADSKLMEWAVDGLKDYRLVGKFLLLEMEGQAPVYSPVDGRITTADEGTVCRVNVTPASSTIEIYSTKDLSLFMRPVKTMILYVLGDTAFAGYVSSSRHDSEDGLYTIEGVVVALPAKNTKRVDR